MAAAALASHRLLWQKPLQHPDIVSYPLRTRNSPDDLTRSRVLWVYCTRFFESIIPMRSLVDGLTLLALINQIDTAVWLQELKLVWTKERDVDWINHSLNEALMPSIVGLNVVVRRGGHLDMVAEYISIQDSDTGVLSPCFESILSSVDERIEQPTVPLCVEVDFDGRDDLNQRLVLQRLVQLVKIQRAGDDEDAGDRKAAVRTRRARMLITRVSIGASFDVQDLRYLVQLSELGVAIHYIPELYAEPTDSITRELVSSLQSLLLPKAATFQGVQSILVSDAGPSRLLPALLSALQDSQSLNMVCLSISEDFTEEEDERVLPRRASMWAWIASTLWGPHSKHQISKLELTMDEFTENDFESFQSAYRYENPMSVDAASGGGTIKPIRILTASRFCLVNPSKSNEEDSRAGEGHTADNCDHTTSRYSGDDGDDTRESNGYVDNRLDSSESLTGTFDDSSIFFESREPLHVREYGDEESGDNEWRTVILPGAGLAWVNRDDILGVSRKERPSSPRGFPQISVSSMTAATMNSVADFISLIGSHTQQLRVTDLYGGDFSIDDWCVRVLTACTRLERIEVDDVRVQDLRLLVDCVAREGVRLRSLSLGFVDAVSLDHVLEFFQILCDSQHPFTTHLEELSLVLVLHDDAEILQPLLSLLQRNRTLHTVSIGFRQGYRARHVPRELSIASRERFISWAQEKVSVRAGPVDMCSKLAFISAIHGQHVPRSSCRSAMDTSILLIIFQFAAPSRIRQVRFLNR